MKKLVTFIVLFFMMSCGLSYATGFSKSRSYKVFDEGYRLGYAEGYNYQAKGSEAIEVPTPPVPAVGKEGYGDGYRQGFDAGNEKRKVNGFQKNGILTK